MSAINTDILRTAQRLYRTWRAWKSENCEHTAEGQAEKRKLILTSWADLDTTKQSEWLLTAESMLPTHTTTTEFCACGEPSPCEYVMAKAWMDKQPKVKGIV